MGMNENSACEYSKEVERYPVLATVGTVLATGIKGIAYAGKYVANTFRGLREIRTLKETKLEKLSDN